MLAVITNDGQSKGFGFVSFDNEIDYQNALNMPNMMLGPNPISVSKARYSSNNNGGGGSGANNQRFNQENPRYRRHQY